MCDLQESAEQSIAVTTTTMDAHEQGSASSLAPTTSNDDDSQSAEFNEDVNEDDTLSTGSPRDPMTADKPPKWNRERNRIHAKNTRERKRQQLEDYHNQIRALLGEKQYLRIVLGDGPDIREDFMRMDIDTIVSLPDFNHIREQLNGLRVMDHDLQLLENMDEINSLKKEGETSNEELLNLRKERNRIHARKTRIRKKNGMKEAQMIFNSLDKEVKHLRSVALAKLPAVTQAAAAAASAGLVDPRIIGNFPSVQSSVSPASSKLSVSTADGLSTGPATPGQSRSSNSSAHAAPDLSALLNSSSSLFAPSIFRGHATTQPVSSSPTSPPPQSQHWGAPNVNFGVDTTSNNSKPSMQMHELVQQQQKLMMLGAAASLTSNAPASTAAAANAPTNPASSSTSPERSASNNALAEQLHALTQLYNLQSMILQQTLPRMSLPGALGLLGGMASSSAAAPQYYGAPLGSDAKSNSNTQGIFNNNNSVLSQLDSDADHSKASVKRARMDFNGNGNSDSYYTSLNSVISPLLNQWPPANINMNNTASMTASGAGPFSAAHTKPSGDSQHSSNSSMNSFSGMSDMSPMGYNYGLPLQPYSNIMLGGNAGIQYRTPLPLGAISNNSSPYSLNSLPGTSGLYPTKSPSI